MRLGATRSVARSVAIGRTRRAVFAELMDNGQRINSQTSWTG